MKLSQSQRCELKKALETTRKKMPADLIAECENHILNEGNIDPSSELLDFIQDYQNEAQKNYDLAKRVVDELKSYNPRKDLEKRSVETHDKTEPPLLNTQPPRLGAETSKTKRTRAEIWAQKTPLERFAILSVIVFFSIIFFFIFMLALVL